MNLPFIEVYYLPACVYYYSMSQNFFLSNNEYRWIASIILPTLFNTKWLLLSAYLLHLVLYPSKCHKNKRKSFSNLKFSFLLNLFVALFMDLRLTVLSDIR